MDNHILDFLNQHNICALTTLLPNGFPHSAAIHFSHSTDPFLLYFSTDDTSRKCQGLLKGETVKGSVVVGLSEEEWITIQMEGEVTAVTDKAELENVHNIHYAKHPHSADFKDVPTTIFLKFTPTWWRYTDFNTQPPKIVSSETG